MQNWSIRFTGTVIYCLDTCQTIPSKVNYIYKYVVYKLLTHLFNVCLYERKYTLFTGKEMQIRLNLSKLFDITKPRGMLTL